MCNDLGCSYPDLAVSSDTVLVSIQPMKGTGARDPRGWDARNNVAVSESAELLQQRRERDQCKAKRSPAHWVTIA